MSSLCPTPSERVQVTITAQSSVYDHPRNTDPAGFPTWQLRAHPRDTATTTSLALGEDILGWRVMPLTQRAYNVVQVAYVDPVTGPGAVTVSDARLNGDGSQGSAPFRRRKLRRNLGKLPLTSVQAGAIANAWLATFSNPTNKVEVELRAVRDASGNPLPLHQVRADANLYVPELAVRGQQLATGPTPGVNQFWIAETLYRETATGDVRLVLQLDNYADRAAALVAALPIVASALSHGAVNWPDVARAALAAAAVAVLLALAKYAKAHGDPALGDVLALAVSSIGAPAGPPSPGDPPAGSAASAL